MKKRILPIGYEYESANIMGGLICILSVFVFLIIVNNTSHPIEISEWTKAAVPIISVGIILIIVDLIRMNKVRVLRKQRDIMMKKAPISGEIVDIKRSQIDRHRRFSGKLDNKKVHLSISYLLY